MLRGVSNTLTRAETGRDTIFVDRSAAFERAEPEDDEAFSDLEDELNEEDIESDDGSSDDQIGSKVRINLSDMTCPPGSTTSEPTSPSSTPSLRRWARSPRRTTPSSSI